MPRLAGRLIKVEFVGHSDQITTEFDGKKYCFSRRHPVKLIPIEVYDYIKRQGGNFINDLIPVGEEQSTPKQDMGPQVENSAPAVADETEKEPVKKPAAKKRTAKRSKK